MSDSIIRRLKVAEKLGIHPATLWRLRRDKDFPEAIRVRKRGIGFLESEIDAWLDRRKTEQRVNVTSAAAGTAED